jgi:hypothetical protein
MKTTLQEIIDDLKVELEINIIAYNEISITKWVLRILESKLEKEKEQIIEAYDRGYKACDLDEALEINKTMFSGDRYYNQTYNQNK